LTSGKYIFSTKNLDFSGLNLSIENFANKLTGSNANLKTSLDSSALKSKK